MRSVTPHTCARWTDAFDRASECDSDHCESEPVALRGDIDVLELQRGRASVVADHPHGQEPPERLVMRDAESAAELAEARISERGVVHVDPHQGVTARAAIHSFRAARE